jgi:hypothetical protein
LECLQVSAGLEQGKSRQGRGTYLDGGRVSSIGSRCRAADGRTTPLARSVSEAANWQILGCQMAAPTSTASRLPSGNDFDAKWQASREALRRVPSGNDFDAKWQASREALRRVPSGNDFDATWQPRARPQIAPRCRAWPPSRRPSRIDPRLLARILRPPQKFAVLSQGPVRGEARERGPLFRASAERAFP